MLWPLFLYRPIDSENCQCIEGGFACMTAGHGTQTVQGPMPGGGELTLAWQDQHGPDLSKLVPLERTSSSQRPAHSSGAGRLLAAAILSLKLQQPQWSQLKEYNCFHAGKINIATWLLKWLPQPTKLSTWVSPGWPSSPPHCPRQTPGLCTGWTGGVADAETLICLAWTLS